MKTTVIFEHLAVFKITARYYKAGKNNEHTTIDKTTIRIGNVNKRNFQYQSKKLNCKIPAKNSFF